LLLPVKFISAEAQCVVVFVAQTRFSAAYWERIAEWYGNLSLLCSEQCRPVAAETYSSHRQYCYIKLSRQQCAVCGSAILPAWWALLSYWHVRCETLPVCHSQLLTIHSFIIIMQACWKN